ncbi:MAG: cobalamin-dependent protein, partial [Deltaproteobacteria bacterium]|nr:cobalamin-dependent protein [Deltaproteobacteria bacterium]
MKKDQKIEITDEMIGATDGKTCSAAFADPLIRRTKSLTSKQKGRRTRSRSSSGRGGKMEESESMEVLLMTPPYHCGVLESAGTWLPTAFVYLAGSLREAGHSVEIYDAMSKFHTYEQIRIHLSEAQPDVVATGAITATIYDCINVLKLAKEVNQETLTILGGVHPTFCWEEILREHHDSVDYVVRGEGEETLVALL